VTGVQTCALPIYHLRAEQDVHLSAPDALEDLVVRPLAGGRVHVHARDARGGERLDHGALDLLGPDAAERQVAGRAPGARDRRRLLVETVVAHEPAPAAVVGERDVALPASPHVPAVPALDEGRVAAPVEQQDDLLAPFQAQPHRADELRREDVATAAPPAGAAGPG